MKDNFIHLHIHSEYSLEDGLIKIDALVNRSVADSMPALALTEQGNLFSALKFYRSAQKAGIKPIIGVEVRVNGDHKHKSSRLILLCQNYQGYINLNALVSHSYRHGQYQGVPYVSRSDLSQYAGSLIALSGAQQGDVGQSLLSGHYNQARTLLQQWQEIYSDRFYIELQRTNHPGENKYIHAAVELASELDLPVVATNNVRFLLAQEFEIHEARICIQQGHVLEGNRQPSHPYTNQQYLRSVADMTALFADIPEAIENTVAIAKRCNLELIVGENYLPDFPVPEDFNQDRWLIEQVNQGLKKRLILAEGEDLYEVQETYQERLDLELEVITSMGFSGYFLIVADFICWAKQNMIPVGPGRGSGAGSLVAYTLGITELDPLQYDLLFERFLNPERVSLPDLDIDFCVERRDEVINYVIQKYGHDRVSQIITYGSMSAKAVIRDAGRVLGYPYGFVDQIAKLIPFDLNMTLDRALQEDVNLAKRYKDEDEVNALFNLAKKLEGIVRNASRHAGGIVISPQPLNHYMALYYEQGSDIPVSQFDMGDVEAIGLVKFDFLGLRTLTIISSTIRDVNRLRKEQSEPEIDINNTPFDDEETYQLIRTNNTTAIFQLESDGMKKLIKRLQPDDFNDLIALVALFRPGPLQSGMVADYIDCKHGKAEIKYLHPKLEHILKSTNGVILYQEQVMQIAQVLAGYTLGAADLLRRAMGKKVPEKMAMQREVFIGGASDRGVDKKTAATIFDLIEKFAGYGFNKSHSAAYALIAYQTAWLKAHYPAYFMATVLSSDMDNTDKVVMLIDEIKSMNIRLLAPAVNYSDYRFKVEGDGDIRFGLGAIKGVGRAAINNITSARDRDGYFNDLFDLCRRVDMYKVNKRVFEAIVRCGATDDLGPGRNRIYASLQKAFRLAEQSSDNSDSGQNDLFGLATSISNQSDADTKFIQVGEWSDDERLSGEKETLGFYLSGHPIIRYEAELEKLVSVRLKDIKTGNKIRIAGYIHRMRTRPGNRGRMADILVDDRTARINVRVYPEVFNEHSNKLIKDQLIIIDGDVVADDFFDNGVVMTANNIYLLSQLRQDAKLCLRLSGVGKLSTEINHLKEVLSTYCRGNSYISVEYINNEGHCRLIFDDNWKVNINDTLLESLQNYLGEDNVYLEYK